MHNNRGLVATILIAAVLISGSMVFLGLKMQGGGGGGEDLQKNIEAGIVAYIQKQQEAAAKAQAEANKPQPVAGDYSTTGAVMGDKNAKVTIVEFSDFQCPYCERFFSGAYPEIKKNYIDSGKVKLVFRHFPLSFHENARPAALASECAREQGGDSMFFQFHDAVFQNQATLSVSMLKELGKKLSLKTAQFDTCLDTAKYGSKVDQDIADGKKAGVNGTPAFIVNGFLISGAQPFSMFQSVIDEALAK